MSYCLLAFYQLGYVPCWPHAKSVPYSAGALLATASTLLSLRTLRTLRLAYCWPYCPTEHGLIHSALLVPTWRALECPK